VRSLRAIAALSVLAGVLAAEAEARGESTVPIGLQLELLAKVAADDKTLPGRAEGLARVVVLTRKGNAESAAAGAHALHALSELSRVAGLPHEDSSWEFADAAALIASCKAHPPSILYLTPGFDDVAEAIARALVGIPVLTATAVPSDVAKGVILGFDLVGGKPKIFVNLTASRNQGVQLAADVLKVATVLQ
jgi:hypothetical protein